MYIYTFKLISICIIFVYNLEFTSYNFKVFMFVIKLQLDDGQLWIDLLIQSILLQYCDAEFICL